MLRSRKGTDIGKREGGNVGPASASPRGRYAPSPTGPIHIGNARTALVAWLSVRSRGGELVWRVEDLDGPRVVPGLAFAQQRDLEWLGLDWDEGPGRGGTHGPYVQSERFELYLDALRRLAVEDRLFPCNRTRRELEDVASAPHARDAAPYPRSLRPSRVTPGWLDEVLAAPASAGAAVRFRVDERVVEWWDLLMGAQHERVDLAVGDFVLRRRDGQWAYQLAVVVDDIAMGITEVVRGADLLDSTARQILLFEALGAVPPRFGHVSLVRTPEGPKLSKRDGSLALGELRGRGVSAEQLVGHLAHSLGLLDHPEPVRPVDLVPHFRWDALQCVDVVATPDLAERLAAGQG
jgi:glutamyl-tRNA synthetase